MTIWTITATATGEVLCPRFHTDSPSEHPEDRGWAWDAGTQTATQIDAEPNVLEQSWDGTGWADDPVKLRAVAWAGVRAARDAAEWAGCDTALGRVDTDPDSQRKIAGAVQMAMIAMAADEPFAIEWTMQDNAVVTHDAAAMVAMGVAVGAHVAACHAAALAARVAMAAAVTRAAIDDVAAAVSWPE